MIVLPAVDIKSGRCVRLVKGDPRRETVYEADPLAAALRWRDEGSAYLHCVDLDGAISGASGNAEHIKRIIAESGMKVEVAGGIRSDEDVARWVDLGAHLVVLGTRAVQDPDAAAALCRRYPGRIVIAVDAREGLVSTHGWTETSAVTAVELAQRLAPAGPAAFLYTDIDRDGTLTQPNFETTRALIEAVPTPVIASGGVSALDDVEECGRIGAGAVIIGKALYDGAIALPDALAAAGRYPRSLVPDEDR